MKKNMKKNMLWMLLSLMAAAIMMPLSATAQEAQTQTTRIAVVSDIHVMAPSLLEGVSESDWNAYYSGQRKMLEQSAGLFDQFINKMEDEEPDILLITGDLTKDGEQASHDYVKAGLETLKNKGIKVYVIPGNHDFGEETLGNDPTKDASKLSTSFASFYADYGYSGSTRDTEGNSLSYVAEPVSGLVLLAIDSHSGSIDPATLTWICNQALSARADGNRVIAMMHHPLFPHITGAEFFETSYTVANYTTVRNALIAAGVNVILTGHFHTSDIAYDWIDNPNDETDKSNGIYDINTGSLISYPCDYRMLTLSADKKTLSVKTHSMKQTETLIPSGFKSWKTWLEDRVRSIAATKFNSFPYNISGLTNDEKEFLSKTAADAFSLHAEGNENTKEASTDLLKDYTDDSGTSTYYSTVKSALSLTFSSMLEDKSNYGNDHANQTADRAIVIDLADPSNLLLELDNNDDNNSIINYYHGKTATVTLTGRTLFKDGKWNTICLPFDINTLTGTPLEDADIRELSTTIVNDGKTTGFNTETNSLILNFTAQEAVTKIEAGKPYIVKWTGSTDITDPSFSGVAINNKAPEGVTSKDGSITFIGTYGWQKFTDENKRILLIGKNTSKSTLFYPESGASLGACRAYFQLADSYTAGVSIEGGGGTIRNFVLNFGDDDSATGIIAIGDSQLSTLNAQRSEWYTLDGRRLAAKPTAKGLYIHAGKKVVIK